ncbi:MAG: hypothetical protein ABI408_08470 [Gemmatimonadaceae bacterium]
MKRTAQLLAGVALLAGCGGEPITTESVVRAQPQTSDSRESESNVNKDLAELRRVTAPFHSFDKATAAGWSAKITACMSDPALGGMGFHYGNTALIDGVARVNEPELLLYEPEKNGDLRLVAVEYIIPYTFHARSAAPPELFGQKFVQNDVFQLWGLHAWVWKDNPSGMFANWNPSVSCKNTTDVMAMTHN